MRASIIIFGLVSGNFLYQVYSGHHWDTAFERSWFQTAAVLVYVIFSWQMNEARHSPTPEGDRK